jgi:hypothetical protein
MAKKATTERKKGIKVKGWVTLKVPIPKELEEALKIQSARKNIHYADLIQGLLESHLGKTGLLEVNFGWDSFGRRVKSYAVQNIVSRREMITHADQGGKRR